MFVVALENHPSERFLAQQVPNRGTNPMARSCDSNVMSESNDAQYISKSAFLRLVVDSPSCPAQTLTTMSDAATFADTTNVRANREGESELASVGRKAYVDRAIQTDDSPSMSVQADDASESSLVQSLLDKLSDMDISTASNVSLADSSSESSVIVDDAAYSLEGLSLQSSPPVRFSNSTRVFKQTEVRVTRPSRTLKPPATRLVSLPETVAAFSAKKALEKVPRVVSNPEHLRRPLRAPEDDDESEQSLNICETPHVGRVATDAPHTPTPPSSPESVVIISNKTHLSESFLRGGTRRNSSASPKIEDDGVC